MKRVLLTILCVALFFMCDMNAQESVLRCKQENKYMILYWFGNTDPMLSNISKNYYDSNNNSVLSVATSFEGEVQSMDSKRERLYSKSNLLKTETTYYWRENINDWVKSNIINYAYNENGDVVKIETMSCFSGEPVLDSYIVYVYDEDGQLVEEVSYSKDFSSDEFYVESKITYFDFVGINKPAKSKTESLDYSTMELIVTYKSEMTYDDDYNCISKITLSKDYSMEDAFNNESKEEWQYQNGLNTEYIRYGIDSETFEFVFNEKKIYDYDSETQALKSIETFAYDESAPVSGWNKSGVNEFEYSALYNASHTPLNLVASEVENAVNTVKLTWENPDNVVGLAGYYVLRDCVVINSEVVIGNEYIDSEVLNGDHVYMIQAVYESGDANVSDVVNVSVFDPSCVSPTNLKVTALSYNESMMEFTVSLSWSIPDTDSEILGYNIYKDGYKVNIDVISNTQYQDICYEAGVYQYHVSALYKTGSSKPSSSIEVTVNLDVVGVDELEAGKDISIYPNPACNNLYFSKNVNLVNIYTVSGKLIKSIEQANNHVTLDGITNGIYVVVTIDENGVKNINKLVINK